MAQSEAAPVKARKPYVIQKTRELWTEEEHEQFEQLLKAEGRNWKHMAEVIRTKSVIQIRSHAQKYFLKLDKDGKHADIPPARAKKRASHPYPKSRPGTSKSMSYSWNAQQEQLAAAAANAAAAHAHYSSAVASPAAAAHSHQPVAPNSAPQFSTNPVAYASVSSPVYTGYDSVQSTDALPVQHQTSSAAAPPDDGDPGSDVPVQAGLHSDSLSLLSSVSSALPPASPLQKAEARRRAEAARAQRAKEAGRAIGMPPQYPLPATSPQPAAHSSTNAALATPVSSYHPAYSSALTPSASAAAAASFSSFAHTPMLSLAGARSASGGTASTLFGTPLFLSASSSHSADSTSGHGGSGGTGYEFASVKKLDHDGTDEEAKADDLPGRLNFDDAALEGTGAEEQDGAEGRDSARKRKHSNAAAELDAELWPTQHALQQEAAPAASAQMPLDGAHAAKRSRLSSGVASPHPLHNHSTSPFLFEDGMVSVKQEPSAGLYAAAAPGGDASSAAPLPSSHRGVSVDWSSGTADPAADAAAAAAAAASGVEHHHHEHLPHYGLAAPPPMAFSPMPYATAADAHNDSSAASATSSSTSSAHTAQLSSTTTADLRSPRGGDKDSLHLSGSSAAAEGTSEASLTPLKSHASSVASSFFSPNILTASPYSGSAATGAGGAVPGGAASLHHLFSPAPHAAAGFVPLPTPREFHTPQQQKHNLALPTFSPVPTPSFY